MPRAYQPKEDADNSSDGFNDDFTQHVPETRREPKGNTDFSRSRKSSNRPQSFDPRASEISPESGKSGKSVGKKGGKRTSLSEDDKQTRSKKLRSLLSNQALCLVIIFGLLGAFNWMATDYSGEYISQDKNLGLVKLSLVRRATTIDGELYYQNTPTMEMQQGEQPKEGQVDLVFVNQNKWAVRPRSIQRARFIGTIDGSMAEGAVVDARGSHPVRLTKNIVASLFKQLQAHIPTWRTPPPPTFFHVPDHVPAKSIMPIPGQARFNQTSNSGAVNLKRRAPSSDSQSASPKEESKPKPFNLTSPFKQFESK